MTVELPRCEDETYGTLDHEMHCGQLMRRSRIRGQKMFAIGGLVPHYIAHIGQSYLTLKVDTVWFILAKQALTMLRLHREDTVR